MLKTVYRSSCRDKHNFQRRDSNLDPVTPQSNALITAFVTSVNIVKSYIVLVFYFKVGLVCMIIFVICSLVAYVFLQCFDAVGWAAGRASGL